MPGQSLSGDLVAAPFLFGKMPAHGDFISRGLDDETVEAGDGVIAEAVALAINRWDAAWDDVYVEMPVWRFLATPGVLGRDWLAGVFLASVDAVGRQFPLVAGFSATSLALLASVEATERALDEAEAVARAALLDGLSVDAALERLSGIARSVFGAGFGGQGPPARVFAAELLTDLESTPWSPRSSWWVAGAGDEGRVRLDGALTGEALVQLFRRLPATAETPAEPPPQTLPERLVAPSSDENPPATPPPQARISIEPGPAPDVSAGQQESGVSP